jgi:hypothetical protein
MPKRFELESDSFFKLKVPNELVSHNLALTQKATNSIKGFFIKTGPKKILILLKG